MSVQNVKNILCSTKSFTKGLIHKVKTMGDLGKLVTNSSSEGVRISNLSPNLRMKTDSPKSHIAQVVRIK